MLSASSRTTDATHARRELKAKQPHVEVLKVSNWLPTPQRFKVTVSRDASIPKATQLSASSHIDVPGLSDKDCKVTVLPFVAGKVATLVTLQNETSGEYLVYKLAYTVVSAGSIAEVTLDAPVRTLVTKQVVISNPLDRSVELRATCTDRLVQLPSGAVSVAAGASASVQVAYMPLLVSESTAQLALECAELGKFEYTLRLRGQPTVTDKALNFKVSLGGSEKRVFSFTHYHPDKAEYKCTFSGDAATLGFSAPLVVNAPPAGAGGVQVDVPVAFEPTNLTESAKSTLTLTSATGGVYECMVVGRCTPPTPQGPVKASGGKGGGSVMFMNPFLKEADFVYSCDNTAFAIKSGEKIASKKQISIGVAFKDTPGMSRTGMLTVTCPSMTPCQWVYYLEG